MPRRPKQTRRIKDRNLWVKMSKEMTTDFGRSNVRRIFNIRRKK